MTGVPSSVRPRTAVKTKRKARESSHAAGSTSVGAGSAKPVPTAV